jgi:hypothetical protein
LNERERHILIERVRQIEVRAFEKLQKAMKAQIAARGRRNSYADVSLPQTADVQD